MESSDELGTKKSRIWNPALDDCYDVVKKEKAGSPLPVNVQYGLFYQVSSTILTQ